MSRLVCIAVVVLLSVGAGLALDSDATEEWWEDDGGDENVPWGEDIETLEYLLAYVEELADEVNALKAEIARMKYPDPQMNPPFPGKDKDGIVLTEDDHTHAVVSGGCDCPHALHCSTCL